MEQFAKIFEERYACKEWKMGIEVPKSIICYAKKPQPPQSSQRPVEEMC